MSTTIKPIHPFGPAVGKWRSRTKHGMFGTKVYDTWAAMIKRCCNPKHHNWKLYGGRGITVCERWRSDFRNFYTDMGDAPPGLQLDRIDNNGDYTPTNCRWATAREQARNRRSTRLITFKGETKCLAEWAQIAGMQPDTLGRRLRGGWPMEKALSVPICRGNGWESRYWTNPSATRTRPTPI